MAERKKKEKCAEDRLRQLMAKKAGKGLAPTPEQTARLTRSITPEVRR